LKNKIIEIIKKKMLTPIMYIIEKEDELTLVGFFDRETKLSAVYDAQSEIENIAGKIVHIFDMRDFDEADRIEITHEAELLFSETALVKAMFEASMNDDFRMALDKKKDLINRSEKQGTISGEQRLIGGPDETGTCVHDIAF